MSSPPSSTSSPPTGADGPPPGLDAALTVAFDRIAAGTALVVLSPVLLAAAAAVALADPGPVIYSARRAGRGGVPFRLFKLRTMRVAQQRRSAITAGRDPRVFPVGRVLRALKLDELPQLWNVLKGDMALVGPRPEDPAIVDRHYADLHRASLAVRPGLSSAGSLYYYTHLETGIAADDPERDYVERMLPVKLAIDLVGIRRASFPYNLSIIARTVLVLVGRLAGRRRFAEPPELAEAHRSGLVVPARSG